MMTAFAFAPAVVVIVNVALLVPWGTGTLGGTTAAARCCWRG